MNNSSNQNHITINAPQYERALPLTGGDGGGLHIQLGGQAFYDNGNYFTFCPDDPVPGRVPRFRKAGIAQQMPDGTFDFVAKPQPHPQSTLIKKLAHGRLSATKDGAIQLTLKVFKSEGLDVEKTIKREAFEAFE